MGRLFQFTPGWLASRPQRARDPSRPMAEPKASDADAEAIKTWPDELRNRLRDRAPTRVILPWRD